MGRTSAQLVFQHLYMLASRHGLSLTDHELLQRFIRTHDEDAFAALVHRHAAMVLRACRSILDNSHDAEDIFQAVFLVLARKAASIRTGDSVASYLYAIAYRLARKARVRDAKRREREQRAASPEATPMDDRTWGELRFPRSFPSPPFPDPDTTRPAGSPSGRQAGNRGRNAAVGWRVFTSGRTRKVRTNDGTERFPPRRRGAARVRASRRALNHAGV